MKTTLSVITFSFALFLVSPPALTAATYCGEAKVISGEECSDMELEFTFDGCKETPPTTSPKKICKKRAGSIAVTGEGFVYKAYLLKRKGKWKLKRSKLKELKAKTAKKKKEGEPSLNGPPATTPEPPIERLQWEGAVEVELSAVTEYGSETTSSDIALAAAVIAANYQHSPNLSGTIGFLYEDGSIPLIDEANFTVSSQPAQEGFVLQMGQTTIPFGSYESLMVSDPLTLQIGEANEKILSFGYTGFGANLTVYGFNGDLNKETVHDEIDNMGLAASYGYGGESWSISLGVGYINHLADSNGLSEFFLSSLPADKQVLFDYVEGFNLNLDIKAGGFRFLTETVTSLDPYEIEELAYNENGATPSVLAVETGYEFALLGSGVGLALGYQTSSESVGLGLPQTITSFVIRRSHTDNLETAFEYAGYSDYQTSDCATTEVCGSGETGSTMTIQVGSSF